MCSSHFFHIPLLFHLDLWDVPGNAEFAGVDNADHVAAVDNAGVDRSARYGKGGHRADMSTPAFSTPTFLTVPLCPLPQIPSTHVPLGPD